MENFEEKEMKILTQKEFDKKLRNLIVSIFLSVIYLHMLFLKII